MAEPVRKGEITTSDLVRDARRQPEPVEDGRGRDAGQDASRNMSGDTRDAQRAGGPQPVPERTDARTSQRGEQQNAGGQGSREMVRRPDGSSEHRSQDATAENTPLFSEAQTNEFRSRWGGIQTQFVDEPRKTVEEADKLVASLMTQLAEGFANERGRLEKQWDRGDDVSTEDLRVALKRYRSFFDRLLKA